jgi:hypothetical protein
MAVVSFTADSAALDLPADRWITPPAPITAAPYAGRQVGLLRGPAGELVEIIIDD